MSTFSPWTLISLGKSKTLLSVSLYAYIYPINFDFYFSSRVPNFMTLREKASENTVGIREKSGIRILSISDNVFYTFKTNIHYLSHM